jgi:Ca2+-transporting ATPase
LGEIICGNFDDFINRVLLGACIVSLIIGNIKESFPEGMIEGTSIAIALCIIIVVGSANEYTASIKLRKLIEMSEAQEVFVFRGSTEKKTMNATELVVGDLIEFKDGNKMPADCIIVEGNSVQCKEDELTGEPDDKDKVPVTEENFCNDVHSVMYAKSKVAAGYGKAIVVAVGTSTAAGVIAEKTQVGSKTTHL